jgi:hypothetical protein
MTAEQAATLKRLAEAAYELEAFQPNLTRAEADLPALVSRGTVRADVKIRASTQSGVLSEFCSLV